MESAARSAAVKIGAITPHRNLRPILLARMHEYMTRQTVKIDEHVFVDYPQVKHPFDLTDRYKLGLAGMRDKFDVIFLIDDDDYYPRDYVGRYIEEWTRAGKPEIFGIGESYFYHPEVRAVWYRSAHPNNVACGYCTMLRGDVIDKIDWSRIDPLWTDIGLWRQLEGKQFNPGPYVIGIKHGRGSCAAAGHNRWFYERAVEKGPVINQASDVFVNGAWEEWAKFDESGQWLIDAIGEEDAQWYFDWAKQGSA